MNKWKCILLCGVLGMMSACDTHPIKEEIIDKGSNTSDAQTIDQHTNIVIEWNEQHITATIYDSPAAKSFLDMLPMECTFEDFQGIEKIAYPKEPFDLADTAKGHRPQAKDLCIYGPWGNFTIFYQAAAYSDDLYLIGHIDQGIEALGEEKGEVVAYLSLAE